MSMRMSPRSHKVSGVQPRKKRRSFDAMKLQLLEEEQADLAYAEAVAEKVLATL